MNMNVKKYLENYIRGWLPKESSVRSIKRTSTPKVLAVYFFLIFAAGIILRIFVTPLLLPDLAKITDFSLASFILLAALLIVVYYLKTQGSPKQIRLFYAFAIGVGLGFPIFAVVTLISNAVTGHAMRGTSLLLNYVFSYTVAFIVGIPVSKILQERTALVTHGDNRLYKEKIRMEAWAESNTLKIMLIVLLFLLAFPLFFLALEANALLEFDFTVLFIVVALILGSWLCRRNS